LLPIILLSTVALVPMIVNDRSQMQFGAALTFAATWWMMPWLALGLWMSKRRARRGEPGFEN
jgi:hypothetical protein